MHQMLSQIRVHSNTSAFSQRCAGASTSREDDGFRGLHATASRVRELSQMLRTNGFLIANGDFTVGNKHVKASHDL